MCTGYTRTLPDSCLFVPHFPGLVSKSCASPIIISFPVPFRKRKNNHYLLYSFCKGFILGIWNSYSSSTCVYPRSRL